MCVRPKPYLPLRNTLIVTRDEIRSAVRARSSALRPCHDSRAGHGGWEALLDELRVSYRDPLLRCVLSTEARVAPLCGGGALTGPSSVP